MGARRAAALLRPALLPAQAGEAHRAAQFPGLRVLPARRRGAERAGVRWGGGRAGGGGAGGEAGRGPATSPSRLRSPPAATDEQSVSPVSAPSDARYLPLCPSGAERAGVRWGLRSVGSAHLTLPSLR